MISPLPNKTVHADDADVILAELVEQFVDLLQMDERIDAASFAAEHPDQAEVLLELLPAAATMAKLRRSALRSATPAPRFCLEPVEIAGYRIVREIGRGGMGVVYEAMQRTTGRQVALKVLPNSPTTGPSQIERFRIEAQAAAALDHPHIVPVFEIGCEQGIHFYAMQLVEGCSLAALILEARAGDAPALMTPPSAARMAMHAAEALAHAHDLGIIHRDIKPANLLIGSDGHLWIADFGLARYLDGGDLTQTGDVLGTLRYLSPEQAKGRRKVDARTDVYSLGATLYEWTTLHRAFDGHDRQDLLRRIAAQEPIPPRRLVPAIPRDLETILATAMAKEVEDRYASAAEFAEDLRRFVEARPILARRAGIATKLARWSRRNRAAVAIALMVMLLLLMGLGAGVVLLWRGQVRTRENLQVALIALDEFCISSTSLELTRDPERAQQVQDLQLKALTIYERMLRQNPADPETRWAATRAAHRVANILARSPRAAEAEPAYRAALQNLKVLLTAAPRDLGYRQELADLSTDLGATLPAGKAEARAFRRAALADHSRLASEFPENPHYRRAVSRDCIEVARSIGITVPAEAVEKEALFRRAVEIRQSLDHHSFEDRAQLAEALAYLGHLLRATDRRSEGDEVMTRGRATLAALGLESQGDPIRRCRVVALEDLYAMPRYCEPAPDPDETLTLHRAALVGKAKLVEEFPFLPDLRASLAWGHHTLAATLIHFGRSGEADERRAIALFDDLLRDHPSVDHFQRWAASASEGLGDMLGQSGRTAEAKACFRQALATLPAGHRGRTRITRKLEGPAIPSMHSEPR